MKSQKQRSISGLTKGRLVFTNEAVLHLKAFFGPEHKPSDKMIDSFFYYIKKTLLFSIYSIVLGEKLIDSNL